MHVQGLMLWRLAFVGGAMRVMGMVPTRYMLGGLVLLTSAVACTEKDSTSFPVVAGSGGSSSEDAGLSGAGGSGSGGDASAAGGSGGSSGSDTPEAGVARFQAVLDGEVVRLTALDPVWMLTCNFENPRVVQRSGDSGDAWTLVTDERPDGFNFQQEAHYLDGVYQSDCSLSLGCDVGGCVDLAEGVEEFGSRVVAREFVQVGELPAAICDGDPADGGVDAGVRTVPAIESRAPTGALGVRLVYYRDDRCRTEPITTDVAVE